MTVMLIKPGEAVVVVRRFRLRRRLNGLLQVLVALLTIR
jgi:hypothetical protein